MSMRDGGTTFVAIRTPAGNSVTYWFDFSLPWDGRARQVRKIEGEESVALAVGSHQELMACQAVRAVLVARFSDSVVSEFESKDAGNPGKGKWFYAFNFLRLCHKEGKLNE